MLEIRNLVHSGFENSVHVTKNGTESWKVLPSGGYKATTPRSPERLRLVLEGVSEAAGAAGETWLSLTSKRQRYDLEPSPGRSGCKETI